MIPWQSTDHLILDRSGILWFRTCDEDGVIAPFYLYLGPVETAAGDVTHELAGEAAELLDLWRDSFDPRAEALDSFHRGLGDPSRW